MYEELTMTDKHEVAYDYFTCSELFYDWYKWRVLAYDWYQILAYDWYIWNGSLWLTYMQYINLWQTLKQSASLQHTITFLDAITLIF